MAYFKRAVIWYYPLLSSLPITAGIQKKNKFDPPGDEANVRNRAIFKKRTFGKFHILK